MPPVKPLTAAMRQWRMGTSHEFPRLLQVWWFNDIAPSLAIRFDAPQKRFDAAIVSVPRLFSSTRIIVDEPFSQERFELRGVGIGPLLFEVLKIVGHRHVLPRSRLQRTNDHGGEGQNE